MDAMSLSNLFNRGVSIVTEEVEAAVHTEAGMLVLNNQIILCPVKKNKVRPSDFNKPCIYHNIKLTLWRVH